MSMASKEVRKPTVKAYCWKVFPMVCFLANRSIIKAINKRTVPPETIVVIIVPAVTMVYHAHPARWASIPKG